MSITPNDCHSVVALRLNLIRIHVFVDCLVLEKFLAREFVNAQSTITVFTQHIGFHFLLLTVALFNDDKSVSSLISENS